MFLKETELTKNIFFIYSMESFICYEMNRACREKDESKVDTLGPIAFII